MRTRLTFLIATLGIAIVAVACGRASERDINAALGITPTPTLSAEQVATGTASAAMVEQTRAAAQASIGSPGAGVSLADTGDVAQGKTQFQLRCARCHQPSGAGSASALAGPSNPATKYTDEQLIELVRTGNGHAAPPGPLTAVTISDRQLINILAFIRDQSK